jgi:hypothetical protein
MVSVAKNILLKKAEMPCKISQQTSQGFFHIKTSFVDNMSVIHVFLLGKFS